ncbi:WD40 repeat-like protein [Ramicandelaber brevisporus]|nr:WD40 repeat-like protein [Ramicandelaber brevisporus]
MSAPADKRQQVIEERRQRLADLRRARAARTQILQNAETALSEAASGATSPTGRPGVTGSQSPALGGSAVGSAGPSRAGARADIDDLVDQLVGRNASTMSTPGVSATASGAGTEPGQAQPAPGATGVATSEVSSTGSGGMVSIPKVEYQVSTGTLLDIPPVERVLYSKEVQTDETLGDSDEPAYTEEEIERRVRELHQKELAAQKQAEAAAAKRAEEERERERRALLLTDSEKESMTNAPAFASFFDRATKLIERALAEPYDFMVDYGISGTSGIDENKGDEMTLIRTWSHPRWTSGRSVTDVVWSQKHPELLVASYNPNVDSPNDPAGVVCVWNLHLKDRPEYIFHASSDVMKVVTPDFQPNLIVGSTYSGQVTVWDMGSKKSNPVLKTPLAAAGGHSHPIYSMKMVGTKNANNLITGSTDGLVCSWQLDMLAQPEESLELLHPHHPRLDDIAVTCFDFPDSETTCFWIGTEEGNVYQANRFDAAGHKAGLSSTDVYTGHSAMVTSLQFHPPSPISVDLADLFVTSSLDWTVQIWRARSSSKSTSAAASAQGAGGAGSLSSASANLVATYGMSSGSTADHVATISPLCTLNDFEDYVYDVKWSPVHPALLAAVDGTGRLSVWNLNSSIEVPTLSVIVGTNSTGASAGSNTNAASSSGGPAVASSGATHAANRLAWDKTGRRIAVASADGNVYVYDIGDAGAATAEDYAKFQRLLSDLSASSNDATAMTGSSNIGSTALTSFSN